MTLAIEAGRGNISHEDVSRFRKAVEESFSVVLCSRQGRELDFGSGPVPTLDLAAFSVYPRPDSRPVAWIVKPLPRSTEIVEPWMLHEAIEALGDQLSDQDNAAW